MKILSSMCKFMVTLGMAMIGGLGIFIFWRIPEHVMASGVNPVGAYLMMVGMYIVVLGFECAGYFGWRVLLKIDAEQAFSPVTVDLLGKIKKSFVAIQTGVVFWLPAIYQLADQEDAPGIIVMVLVILCIPITVGIIFAIIQRLLMMAINRMKNQ